MSYLFLSCTEEIFNDRDLSQDVTSVIFDILEAVKLDQSIV